jgi:hypothetical protein
MGDIFGGKQKSTTTTEPFSGAQKALYEAFQPYVFNRVTNPRKYTGDLTADMTDTQKQAIDNLRVGANNSIIKDYAAGSYVDPMNNKYVQDMASVITQTGKDAWGEQGKQVNSLFNKNSFWGGSAHQDQLAKTAKDINQTTQNAIAGLYKDAYDTGVNQMLQAKTAQQSADNALLNAGNTEYGIQDAELTRKYEAWLKEQGLSDNDIAMYLQYLGLGKNPTQTQTTKSSGLGGVMGSLAGGWASTWG